MGRTYLYTVTNTQRDWLTTNNLEKFSTPTLISHNTFILYFQNINILALYGDIIEVDPNMEFMRKPGVSCFGLEETNMNWIQQKKKKVYTYMRISW